MTGSRRDFIKLGFLGTASGLAATGSLHLLEGRAQASTPRSSTPLPHPWISAYTPLDLEYTRKLGHQGCYLGGCAFGTFRAIIGQLANTVGSPFNTIPLDMMRWGASGVAGFATFCGALNGSSVAIGLLCDPKTANAAISDLLSWHAQTPLPTEITNTYAANGEYQALLAQVGKTIKTPEPLPASISGSNLCHTSVTNWCLASYFASGSIQRAERCARLVGDVAAKAVELLNMVYRGEALPGYVVPGDQSNCRTCHHVGPDIQAGQFTRGKMDCLSCHVDLTQIRPTHHPKHCKNCGQ